MSQNDISKPFWIAQIVALSKESAPISEEIRVRWFQASGSASDPYDAAYIPSVRKRGSEGEITYWESTVQPSEVILQFETLTNEKRIDMSHLKLYSLTLTNEKRIDSKIVRELKATRYQYL